MERYHQVVDSHGGEIAELVDNKHVSLVQQDHRIGLYTFSMNLPRAVPASRPYVVAGLGGDVTDYELSSFYEEIPREGRANIELIKGLTQLLHAVDRASKKNLGVGGVPQLIIVHNGKTIMPSERSCLYSIEIFWGSRHGYFERDFHDAALTGLLLKDNYATMEDTIRKQLSNKYIEFTEVRRGHKLQ